MKQRWIAAGMLEAERSFRRLKGHADMPTLVAAVTRATTRTLYTRQLRSGRLSKFGITTALQQRAGVRPGIGRGS